MVQANRFSTQISVAELLGKWPQAIPVFFRYHLDCVGCSMAAFETLSEVIAIYHLPEELFMAELERAVQAKPLKRKAASRTPARTKE